ncbi:hypothetical protein ACFB49_42350 [Sphingomonas sp. DBB INV C78]|uniref:hypothetical protein n=1 Tax=Sphingomonas sp. DBB INV C78 TaxID=3349434 RepID=UPI0036D365F6
MKQHVLGAAALLAVGVSVAGIYIAATSDSASDREAFGEMMSAGDPDWKMPRAAPPGNASSGATNLAEN